MNERRGLSAHGELCAWGYGSGKRRREPSPACRSADGSQRGYLHSRQYRAKSRADLEKAVLTSEIDKVVVLQAVHGLQLTTDVVLSSGMIEVLDSRVRLIIGTEDLLGLKNPFGEITCQSNDPKRKPTAQCDSAIFILWRNSLVGLVDVVDGQDRKVAVVPEVSQDDPLACFQAELIYVGLGHVKGDGHREENAIGQTILFHYSVARNVLDPHSQISMTKLVAGGVPIVILLVHETCDSSRVSIQSFEKKSCPRSAGSPIAAAAKISLGTARLWDIQAGRATAGH